MKILKLPVLAITIFLAFNLSAQVAVNTDGTVPHTSAMLDVSSTDKGILIPRMTAAERNDINSPEQGLLVFVTTDNCFYSYAGSEWVKMLNADNTDDDWDVNGDNVYVLSAKSVGIGISVPTAKLDIRNSTALKPLYIVNTNTSSDDNYGVYSWLYGAGSGKQYGSFQRIENSGDGYHYGSFNTLGGAGNGLQIGTHQFISNTGTASHYGNYSKLYGSGIGNQYGSRNEISNYGDGTHYGVNNILSGAGNGIQYGNYQMITNTGTNSHYGSYNSLSGDGSGIQYGVYQTLTNSGDASHYGSYNRLSGSGSGSKYGFYTSISTSTGGIHYGLYSKVEGDTHYAAYLKGRLYVEDNAGIGTEDPESKLSIYNSDMDTSLSVLNNSSAAANFGVYSSMTGVGTGHQYASVNDIDNSGDGYHYGNLNKLSGSGSGLHYGSFNYLSGAGTGNQYGNYQNIAVSSNSHHYGSYNTLSGSGSGNKYGTYVSIPESAGGTHYGVFSMVTGSLNFAGYFSGRVYMNDKLGIRTASPEVELDVRGDFQVKNANADAVATIIATNSVYGDAYLQIESKGSTDLAQVKLYNDGAFGASIGYDKDDDRIFFYHGVKNVFIKNGDILPHTHKSQNLGANGTAWNNIYYDDMYNQGAASFTDREVSEEIINYPPMAKAAGSFDYKTKSGLIELDPNSLPDALQDENSILTDEVVTYNYKANYEQQLQINELKKIIEQQNEKIEALIKIVSEK